ncbi:hypothetical protein [Gordonia hydrophobica]|uniref:Uncharacterized protein n=1 Tax=Gordonia hydrophobica TaxID=40516 RepID=A0ABZ2TZQ6_9ACTN|nr:hypothetical protein [Gordonia hydrophobica]MBM7366345.1 hypothetical protein [Gordonia hydrophobica]
MSAAERREAEFAEIDRLARELAEAAPPLTARRRERLRALLSGLAVPEIRGAA